MELTALDIEGGDTVLTCYLLRNLKFELHDQVSSR